jgi:phage recombination protein Bet
MTPLTAVAQRDAVTAPTVTSEQIDLIRRTVAHGATDDELKLYLFDCARQGVHPLDKLVHFTKRSGKYTPITSIDFMRIRAADSGEMAGSDDPDFNGEVDDSGNGPPASATVTVYRLTQGQRFAYTATARWSEYKPESNDFMWRKMPHTMLGKCAEALALRKGFPRQLAGLYATEELDQSDGPKGADVVDAPTAVARTLPSAEETRKNSAAANGGELAALIRGLTTFEATDAGMKITRSVPPGFALIDEVVSDGKFWHITWGRDSQGGSTVYKTKLEKIANDARAAFDAGLPVRLLCKSRPWLDKVEVAADDDPRF